jgi:hypothetical protein
MVLRPAALNDRACTHNRDCPAHVRFTPDSDRIADIAEGPLRAKTRTGQLALGEGKGVGEQVFFVLCSTRPISLGPLSHDQFRVSAGRRVHISTFARQPAGVVVGADALNDTQMAAFANWTNLSETTFLLQPRMTGADYRVRIFTPQRELPFAGHPTLGSCYVWLASGGKPNGHEVMQECEIGLVRIRRALRRPERSHYRSVRRRMPVLSG